MKRNVLENYDVTSYKPRYREALETLLRGSFGGIAERRGGLDRRVLKYYKLVFDDTVPVAVSGIVPPELTLYDGYEVSWTCTAKEYRGWGICTELVRRLLLELPDDGVPVFCECWRFPGKRVNLFRPMVENGFQTVIPETHVHSTKFSVLCGDCPYKRDEGAFECRCYCDTWRLDRPVGNCK